MLFDECMASDPPSVYFPSEAGVQHYAEGHLKTGRAGAAGGSSVVFWEVVGLSAVADKAPTARAA